MALDDLSVTVTGTYDGPRFRAISIRAGIGCDASEIPELVAIAERVCYVTNTLRTPPEITVQARCSGS